MILDAINKFTETLAQGSCLPIATIELSQKKIESLKMQKELQLHCERKNTMGKIGVSITQTLMPLSEPSAIFLKELMPTSTKHETRVNNNPRDSEARLQDP
jgi:hypothetical protein